MESGLQDLTEGQANRNVNTLGTKQTIHAKQQHVETSVYIYIYLQYLQQHWVFHLS